MNIRTLKVLALTMSFLASFPLSTAHAQVSVSPAKARAIAKEAYIYGFPMVVAAKVGVSPSKVSEWASGTRPPSVRGKKALAFTFGIPEDSWGEPRTVHRSRTW